MVPSQPANRAGRSSASASPDALARTFPYPFSDGVFVRVLGSAQYRPLPEEPQPAAGMRFISVTVLVQNGSSGVLPFALKDAVLEDARGVPRPALFWIAEANRLDRRDVREAPPGLTVSWG